jgi:hypothetical protein
MRPIAGTGSIELSEIADDTRTVIGGIMQATLTIRRHSTVAIAVASVIVAGVAAAGVISSTHTTPRAGSGVSHSSDPGWQVALNARSAALNQRYGLGGAAQGSAVARTPARSTALMARSDALDRKYGLGVYAHSTPTASGWYSALMARGAAHNYPYAVTGLPCAFTCEARDR